MTYTFFADLYGTSWWHSHYSAQYAGGLFGSMVIHGPKNAPYDVDLGPILLSDWYHNDYYSIVEEVMGVPANPAPASDNNLINGKMNFNCAAAGPGRHCRSINSHEFSSWLMAKTGTSNAGLSKFRFKAGKKHRLRLINSGAEGLQRFTIDGHSMTVIANDFVPVRPYSTKVVTLGVSHAWPSLALVLLSPLALSRLRSSRLVRERTSSSRRTCQPTLPFGCAPTSVAPVVVQISHMHLLRSTTIMQTRIRCRKV